MAGWQTCLRLSRNWILRWSRPRLKRVGLRLPAEGFEKGAPRLTGARATEQTSKTAGRRRAQVRPCTLDSANNGVNSVPDRITWFREAGHSTEIVVMRADPGCQIPSTLISSGVLDTIQRAPQDFASSGRL